MYATKDNPKTNSKDNQKDDLRDDKRNMQRKILEERLRLPYYINLPSKSAKFMTEKI